MLLQTLARAEELTDSGIEVERRAVIRYLCDGDLISSPLLTREGLWARVRNISREGVGLLHTAPIELGTKVVIEMKTVDPAISLTLRARVVHVTMQEEGSWLVGCKFLTKPTEGDLLALL
jgi:hypothetical protein